MSFNKEVSEGFQDQAWDDFIRRTPDGHYTQMALWSEVKAIQGWNPIRIVYRRDDEITGGAQILWRVRFGIRMGYISKGPLYVAGVDADFLRQMIRDIQEIAREYRLEFLAIQPSNHGSRLEAMLPEMNTRLNYQGDLEKPATMRIDLSPDPEEILQKIHVRRRRWVRRSTKNDFNFRQGTREDIPIFFELHQMTGDRNAFDVQSLEFFYHLWDAFSPRNMIVMFLGEYEGRPLNAALMMTMRDTIEGYRFGWSGEHSKIYPNEAFTWYKMMWGKDHGYHWMDFGGLDLETAKLYLETGQIPENKLRTYTANKLHYGGEVLFFPQTYEYIYRPSLRWTYNAVNENKPLRQLLRNGYKLIRSR